MRMYSLAALALLVVAAPPPTSSPAPEPTVDAFRAALRERVEYPQVQALVAQDEAVVIGMSKVLALASIGHLAVVHQRFTVTDSGPPGLPAADQVNWAILDRSADFDASDKDPGRSRLSSTAFLIDLLVHDDMTRDTRESYPLRL